MDHVSSQLAGTLLLPKWYTLITEVVHSGYRSGTSSLLKTGTLLVTDYTNKTFLFNLSYAVENKNFTAVISMNLSMLQLRVITRDRLHTSQFLTLILWISLQPR